MVKKTVDENEVEFFSRDVRIGRDICHEEIATILFRRTFNIARINVDAEVTSVRKKCSVSAWAAADVQNIAHRPKIRLPQDRSKFLLCERGLPKGVNGGLLEERVGQLHLVQQAPLAGIQGLIEYRIDAGREKSTDVLIVRLELRWFKQEI